MLLLTTPICNKTSTDEHPFLLKTSHDDWNFFWIDLELKNTCCTTEKTLNFYPFLAILLDKKSTKSICHFSISWPFCTLSGQLNLTVEFLNFVYFLFLFHPLFELDDFWIDLELKNTWTKIRKNSKFQTFAWNACDTLCNTMTHI